MPYLVGIEGDCVVWWEVEVVLQEAESVYYQGKGVSCSRAGAAASWQKGRRNGGLPEYHSKGDAVIHREGVEAPKLINWTSTF